jgi:hypothetical protein
MRKPPMNLNIHSMIGFLNQWGWMDSYKKQDEKRMGGRGLLSHKPPFLFFFVGIITPLFCSLQPSQTIIYYIPTFILHSWISL